MKPTARKRLGKYVLLGRLGHGGMGKIYLAYAPGPVGIEKLLVIKRLHSHLTSDPVLVDSFLDEARLSMALSHPNIVHTYDVGEVGGRYFMVMEYIDGQNVGVLLRTAKRSGHYPNSALWAGMFLGVLDGLHAAHEARDARGRPLSIIHRDVSPQNIILTYDGAPKLVDFGIAKAAQRISETDAGVLKGKYSYMSPEQTQSHDLDPRSDVFAAGIVFWEMLAGRRLYKSDSVVKSVQRICDEPPISPVRVNQDCDPALAKVVIKALQKKREDRFSSAEEFRHAIDDALRAGDTYFRQSDVRKLMSELFTDVRERQREVLDGCLAAAAAAEPESTSQVRRRVAEEAELEPFDGGSESDLEIPNLGLGYDGNETTTPSSALRSPLVTQEDEEHAAIPGVPEATTPDKKKPKRPSSPRGSDPGPLTREDPPGEERRDGFVRIAAALALLLLLALVGIAWTIGAFDRTPSPSVVSIQRHEVDLPAREAAPAKDSAKSPGKERDGPPKDVAPPAGDGERDDDAAAEEPKPDERRDEAKADRRRRVVKKRRRRARETTKEPAPPATPAPTAEKKRDRTSEAVPDAARLTLETVPWTTVYLGQKRLGETPVINVSIPPGDVVLTLVNEGKGIRQEYFLKAEPGKSYRKRLKLD